MLIYLAAVETAREHARAAYAAKAPNVLSSFYYAGWKKKRTSPDWIACMRQASKRLIDSGAYTVRAAMIGELGDRSSGNVNVDYDSYLFDYIRWTKHMDTLGLVDFFVETDIASVVSQQWVDRQRRQWAAVGLNHKLVNVWHSAEHDWDYWLWMLREATAHGRSRYVAIEGHAPSRERHDYRKFLHEAYKRGVKVHGFMMTAHTDLVTLPFYSVDSSSWITPSTLGCHLFAQPVGGIKTTRGMKGRGAVFSTPLPTGMNKGARQAVLVMSAAAWVRESVRLNNVWVARGVDWDAAIANPQIVE